MVSFGHGSIWASTKNVQQKIEAHSDTPKPAQPAHLTSLNVTERVKNTLIFNTFVLCQVFNEFNARSLEKKNVFRGLHKNRLFVGIIVVTVVLQVVMVEFLKRFADTERLNWGQWGVCLAIAAASWPIGWLVKSVPVPEKHFFSYLKWTKRS